MAQVVVVVVGTVVVVVVSTAVVIGTVVPGAVVDRTVDELYTAMGSHTRPGTWYAASPRPSSLMPI